MMNAWKRIILILTMLAWLISNAAVVYAEENMKNVPYVNKIAQEELKEELQKPTSVENGIETYSQALSAVTMSGYETTNYQYFEIEEYWHIEKADLQLKIKASQLINEQKSSITLAVNGTPFHSFRPTVDENELQIAIPKELLITGVNTLMIEGSQKTIRDAGQYYNICEVEHNRDNWLTIEDSSSILLTYTKQQQNNSIADFYREFVGSDTVKSNKHAVVIHPTATSKELEAALYSLAGLAKSKTDGNQTIPLMSVEDTDTANKELLIYFSQVDKLPQAILEKLGPIDGQQQALMKLLSVGDQELLVVTSESDQLLLKAGKYLANEDLMLQTAASEKWIDEATETNTPAVPISQIRPLTETGDRIVGPYHQEREYYISFPANQGIAEASKIRLDMRYSQNLDFNRSLVTVLINEKPIGSKKLHEALANQDILELSIPTNLDVNGNFTVTVAFDLEVAELPCVVNQEQMPWAYIDNSSRLQINTVERNDLLFNHFPSNFMKQGGIDSTAIILPSELSSLDYNALANLMNILGRTAETNIGELQVFRDTVDSESLVNKHLIVLGSYQNNKYVREMNKQLYIQYEEEGNHFISNEKKSLEQHYGQKIGTLQLLASPYSEGYGMLMITGPQPQYYELASQLLASENVKWQLYGDAVITDMDKQILSFRFKKEEQQDAAITNILERKDVLSFIISAVLTITVALVALLLVIRKYWRKRRKHDETTS